jgi:hypothetical protein
LKFKNKHLVLLFLAVVALAVALRYISCKQPDQLEARLFPIASESIDFVAWDNTEFKRSEEGKWVANRFAETVIVPDSILRPTLQALARLTTLKVINSERPDTLGVAVGQNVLVRFRSSELPEAQMLAIGRTVLHQDGRLATWVALPQHKQYYLADGDLRGFFQFDMQRFRPNQAFNFNFEQLCSTKISSGDQVLFEANRQGDSLVIANPLKGFSLGMWRMFWPTLAKGELATDFSESQARETFWGTVLFKGCTAQELELKFYFLNRFEPTDDEAQLKALRKFQLHWVMTSSQQPGRFFYVHDTQMLRWALFADKSAFFSNQMNQNNQ